MDPLSIAIICVAVFGVVAGLTAFVRQLLLSRDKNLNDKAQQRALAQEAGALEAVRLQMSSNRRLDAHYQVLGSNRSAIQYLDEKIEDKFKRKSELIQRYVDVVMSESSAMIAGQANPERKLICDRLKLEIDSELKMYDLELANLQQRRANLWDTHHELQEYLIDQENRRNEHLDDVYLQHTALLDKMFVRHNENSESMARLTVEAGTSNFKSLMMTPVDFLKSFFKRSSSISPEAAALELERRKAVSDAEEDLNAQETPQNTPIRRPESLNVNSLV